ncbi:type II toxin-antitoxin system prevent-host-death family antitoxin [Orrella sp. JC864]|uniref:type II toxin-antitoxin system prevent-host-death family antitoxin n=1 Tax=Orrella sp. JC864 TaxID=3120298 RepID=UPI0012BC15AF
MALPQHALDQLVRKPAAEVKKQGWRGIMRTVADQGKVLITNHNTPEAVILSTQEYAALVAAAQSGAAGPAALEALRQRFDARMASLDAPDAADRLRRLIAAAPALDGAVKAGSGH